jgi:cytochrome c peroxidase
MRTLAVALLTLFLLAATLTRAADLPGVDGYEPMAVPDSNPFTRGKALLGHDLFFDKRLSGNERISCSSCHVPQYAFTQGPDPSPSAYGKKIGRACPSLVNVGHHKAFFWEGSATSLEDAVKGVWLFILVQPKPDRPTAGDIAARLNADPAMRKRFARELGGEATPDRIVNALATYLRTLTSDGSKWMRFYRGNDPAAFPPAARRGYLLFDGKAGCTNCHSGVLLTDLQFHNVGVGSQVEKPDPGRGGITKNDRERGAFKTPSLLNVGRTAPYFHDHSVKTLEEAVDQMLAGGIANPHLDGNLKPAHLTAAEREDLLAFLRALDTPTAGAAPRYKAGK